MVFPSEKDLKAAQINLFLRKPCRGRFLGNADYFPIPEYGLQTPEAERLNFDVRGEPTQLLLDS